MINKVTNNIQCSLKFLFFLLTLYKSLNNFLSGTSNAIFSFKYFFQRFSEKSMKKDVWGAPSRRDEHHVLPLCAKMCIFPEGNEMPILWLKPPFNEFRTRVNEQEFTLGWQDSRWVPSLACTFLFIVMSSSRKPACYWFCLWRELHTEGEQVTYSKSKLVLLLSGQMQEAIADSNFFTITRTGEELLRCQVFVSI